MSQDPNFTDIDLASSGQRAARELVETEDVIKALVNDKTTRWIASNDPVERERLHAEVRAMDEFRAELKARANVGAAARKRLDEQT